MQQPRHIPTLAVVLGVSFLFACDTEQDLDDETIAEDLELDDDDDGELMIGDMPSELPELELGLEAVSDEQTTEEESWCGVYGPSNVLANTQKVGTAEIAISAQLGNWDFDLTQQYMPFLSSWDIKRTYSPYAVVASTSANLGWNPFVGRTGDTFTLTMQAPANAAPGSVYTSKIRLNGAGQCTDYYVNLRIADCRTVGWWHTTPWPTPGFDNANCYVTTVPPGQEKFIWNNSWYVKPTNGNQCAVGGYDGDNCYIGSPPGGRTAFFYNDHVYFTP
jgi:hypothetical protein